MATTIPEINLFLDYFKPGGSEPLLDEFKSKPVYTHPSVMSGDVCKLRIYFRKRGTTAESASTEETLPAGSTIVVAGKTAADLTSDALFCASSFSEVTGLSGAKCYESTLDLNNVPLMAVMAALGNTITKLTALVDIEVRNSGNTSRVTYRSTIEIYRQVYDGLLAPSPLGYPEIVMVSPNGSYWKVGVADTGQVEIVATTIQPAYTSLTMVSPGGTHYGLSVTDAGAVQIVSLE
jgi:hypothetical protein